jgi:hypothetical protein
MLIDIALCEDLFHTTTGTAFADIIVGAHRETWPMSEREPNVVLRKCGSTGAGFEKVIELGKLHFLIEPAIREGV